jgi:hypothetical protein
LFEFIITSLVFIAISPESLFEIFVGFVLNSKHEVHLLVLKFEGSFKFINGIWEQHSIASEDNVVQPLLELIDGEGEVLKEFSVLIGGHIHAVFLWSVSVSSISVEVYLVLDQVDVHYLVLSSDFECSGHHDTVFHQLFCSEKVHLYCETHSIIENGVDIELSKLNLDVFEISGEFERRVWSKLLLKDLNMLTKRGGS